MGCMRLVDIVANLNALKGSGALKRIAQISGVDYSTIVRIARGEIPNPGVITCERIAAAIQAIDSAEAPKGRNEYVRAV
jgi:hypothetical protein